MNRRAVDIRIQAEMEVPEEGDGSRTEKGRLAFGLCAGRGCRGRSNRFAGRLIPNPRGTMPQPGGPPIWMRIPTASGYWPRNAAKPPFCPDGRRADARREPHPLRTEAHARFGKAYPQWEDWGRAVTVVTRQPCTRMIAFPWRFPGQSRGRFGAVVSGFKTLSMEGM
jgi:hypothetical protein